MRVLSLFDGMGCGYEALKRADIAVSEYHAYEVDKHAIQIAKKNHPDIIHHGEINFMTDFKQFEGFDLLIGGSPCQGFSSAGKGLNFSDPRSQLFFEFVRAKREMKPKYFMLENVKMKKEWLDIISEQMGVQPVCINSALVSAQNRVRYYWCNWGVEQPEDRGLLLRDIVQHGIEPQPEGQGWHKWFDENKEFQLHKGYSKILSDEDKAITMTARQYASWNGNFIIAQRGRNIVDGKRKDYLGAPTEQRLEPNFSGKSNCLTSVQKDNYLACVGHTGDKYSMNGRVYSEEGKSPSLLANPHGGNRPPLVGENSITYRKLTPIECERLQTLPDDYTAGVSNSQRYKMLSNGWTVEVIAHIFEQLKNKIV